MALSWLVATTAAPAAVALRDGAYQVYPGDDLQEAVDLAGANPECKVVRVHDGVYAPSHPGQALVSLNRAHDGVHLEGVGRPVLAATNLTLATPGRRSGAAVVNHVLYLGDGLSSNTVIAHLRLTGANHFVTTANTRQLEPDQEIRKGRFYFGDGGAIKIYHRSYPVLRDLEIVDNFASPCAGGVSIQHEGATNGVVLIENCLFRNNRSEVTGAALDLLWGSSARVVHCRFEDNCSNTGPGEGENPFSNNGVVTVFERSRLSMEGCVMTGNRNGVDDRGGLSEYLHCEFRANNRDGGFSPQPRFELDLPQGGTVRHCVIDGPLRDPRGAVKPDENALTPNSAR